MSERMPVLEHVREVCPNIERTRFSGDYTLWHFLPSVRSWEGPDPVDVCSEDSRVIGSLTMGNSAFWASRASGLIMMLGVLI